MKISLAFLLTFVLFTSSAQKKEFGWLIGKWKLQNKDIFETWELDKDGKTLNSVSFQMKGNTAEVMEEVKLVRSGEAFFYIPDVAGDQDPVEFQLTTFTEDSFVAENPKHDFPKLIRYKFVKKDGKEYIEAAIEGDGKVIPYYFERVR